MLKVDKLKAEQERLQEIVKEQNLSPEEVMEMNQTHETLTRTLEDLKQKIAETHKQIMAHEVSATNRVAAVEEALDQYTNLLSNLELFPPLEEPWENIDLTLELNPAASNPQQLLVGSDIRKVVKPTLSAIAESKRVERSALETERIKVDDELDQVIGENENMEGEIADGEKKIATLTDQADSIRDVSPLSLWADEEWEAYSFRLHNWKPKSQAIQQTNLNETWLPLELRQLPVEWVSSHVFRPFRLSTSQLPHVVLCPD